LSTLPSNNSNLYNLLTALLAALLTALLTATLLASLFVPKQDTLQTTVSALSNAIADLGFNLEAAFAALEEDVVTAP
jgi:predicted permease